MSGEQTLLEEWRPIPRLAGYEASSDGRVRRNGRVLKPYVGKHGYAVYSVRFDGAEKRNTYRAHALIMEAFVGPRPVDYHIAHRDGDKLNNRIDNLRYCTPHENRADDVANGTRPLGSGHGSAKLTEGDVASIKVRLAEGETCAALSREFGVRAPTIAKISKGETWRHV